MASWQRICVIGGSGSGKSTLATALGEKYHLPSYHLDRELLHGQFESYPFAEQQRRHTKLITAQQWVIDGSYNKLIDDRLARTQLVVFLNTSRLRTIPRVLRRFAKSEHRKESVPGEAKNAMSWKFLLWCLKYNRRKRFKNLHERCTQHKHLTLIALPSDTVPGWLERIGQLPVRP